MKKRLLISILIILCFAIIAFNGCTDNLKTITFVTNGGSAINPITVKDGETLPDITPPTRDGYEFVGWYTDPDCTQEFDMTTEIHKDMTLYAKWENASLIVSFVTNGGSEIAPITVKEGDALSVTATTTKENHVFVGWYTDPDCTDAFADGTVVTANITLYAKWERTHYSVTFILPDGAEEVVKVTVGQTLDVASLDLYDTGRFICIGWKDQDGNNYDADTVIQPTSDLVLTGEYEQIDFWYVLDDSGEFYIIRDLINYELVDVVIPETFKGLPVRELRYLGYSGSVKTVYIPDTITTIGEEAFADLYAIESINAPFIGGSLITELPSGDDFVGKEGVFGYWFEEDEFGLTSNEYRAIPSQYYAWYEQSDIGGIKYKVNTYFLYPTSLKTVTIRNGVIPDIGFYNATTIEKVVLGDEVTAIGEYAFANDFMIENEEHKFRELEFGVDSKLSSFGKNAFRGNYSLETVTIPKGVTVLPEQVFYSCCALKNVIFAEGSQLTTIEQQAFYVDNVNYPPASLQYITLPESLTTIGTMAFTNCNALKEITIPANVTTIGGAAFRFATSLETVIFAEGNSMEELEGGVFNGCSSLTSVTLPETMHILGAEAFSGCSSLQEFDFSTISEIGRLAFNDTGFVTVVLPSNITKLGSSAFALCDNLTTFVFECEYSEDISFDGLFTDCWSLASVTLPKGLTTIGDSLFKNCASLTSIVIPASVTTIGSWAFGGMSGNLMYVTFEDGSMLETIGDHAFYQRDKIVSISLPATLKTIGAYAFEFCTSLTTVQFAEGSEGIVIGERAFHRDFRLETIDLTCVTSIGNNAFDDCSALASVSISSTLETMGSNVFARTDNLGNMSWFLSEGLTADDINELTINVDMTEVEAFAKRWPIGWSGNATVIYKAGGEEAPSIYQDDNWQGIYEPGTQTITILKYVGSSANVALPDTIEYMGMELVPIWSTGVFEGNTVITRVSLSDALTEIPDNFFNGCSNLQEVKLPSDVVITRIGDYAFNGASAIATIEIDLANVTSIGVSAFDGLRNWTANITLTSALTSIGARAFYNCQNLSINLDGALDNLTEISDYAFYSVAIHVDGGVLTIPANITSIGDSAFRMAYKGNVTAIVIEGASYIGAYAFASFSGTASGRQRLDYIIIKGEPSVIGDEFASGAATAASAYTPIYFDSMTFTTESNGRVSVPDGWGSMWYYRSWDDDTWNATYFKIYGKGDWRYEDGRPTAVAGNESESAKAKYGTYKGQDEWGEYKWTITIDEEGIHMVENGNEYEITFFEEVANGWQVYYKNSTRWYIHFITDESGEVVQIRFFNGDKDSPNNWNVAGVRGTLDRI